MSMETVDTAMPLAGERCSALQLVPRVVPVAAGSERACELSSTNGGEGKVAVDTAMPLASERSSAPQEACVGGGVSMGLVDAAVQHSEGEEEGELPPTDAGRDEVELPRPVEQEGKGAMMEQLGCGEALEREEGQLPLTPRGQALPALDADARTPRLCRMQPDVACSWHVRSHPWEHLLWQRARAQGVALPVEDRSAPASSTSDGNRSDEEGVSSHSSMPGLVPAQWAVAEAEGAALSGGGAPSPLPPSSPCLAASPAPVGDTPPQALETPSALAPARQGELGPVPRFQLPTPPRSGSEQGG
jgi:hypothetical protein